MAEIVTTANLYVLISGMVFIYMDMLLRNALSIMNDREAKKLFGDTKLRFIALMVVSVGWIITIPIMIYTNIKENQDTM